METTRKVEEELTLNEHLARLRDRLWNEVKALDNLERQYPEYEADIEFLKEKLKDIIQDIGELIAEIVL